MSYNSGAGGGGAYNFTGNAAASVFNYFAHGGKMDNISFETGWIKFWTDAVDARYGQFNIWKTIDNGLMETYNSIESLAKDINRFPAKDFPAFLDKHFNGGLGYADMAVKTYNKIPNNLKRNIAYNLSKITPMRAGKIFQNSKNFMTKAGKIAGKFGKASTVLSGVAIGFDILDDGKIKTSSIVNGGLLIVGLAVPVTAPFILAYGVLDYTFDIGDKIDEQLGEVNTHIYD